MELLCERLARAGMNAVKWVEGNHVVSDNSKDEMIGFTRQRKSDLRKWLGETQITVREHTMRFNIEATEWLDMYLNTNL